MALWTPRVCQSTISGATVIARGKFRPDNRWMIISRIQALEKIHYQGDVLDAAKERHLSSWVKLFQRRVLDYMEVVQFDSVDLQPIE